MFVASSFSPNVFTGKAGKKHSPKHYPPRGRVSTQSLFPD